MIKGNYIRNSESKTIPHQDTQLSLSCDIHVSLSLM